MNLRVLDLTDISNRRTYRLPYTIIVDSILVDFQELNYGEEIGVFSDSLCVGIGIKGVAGNIQIISWEEDENYGLQGFSTGDSITFKFWGERYDENREADLFTSFTIGNGLFGFQPMTVVDFDRVDWLFS